MNFGPYFPHLLSNLGEIHDKDVHITLFIICEFHENRKEERFTFVVSVI
jgi:hypothetical protein